MIGLGLLLLVLSTPCELFPAIVWRYVIDEVVQGQHTSPRLTWWFSLGGRLHGPYAMLAASVAWLVVIYVLGEVLGTLCTWILNRVAQRFMLTFRNRVYHKLQCQSLSYLQRQRTGDLMSRAMSDVDEVQSFIVGSIDVILSEGIAWAPMILLILALGVYPHLIFHITDPAMTHLGHALALIK